MSKEKEKKAMIVNQSENPEVFVRTNTAKKHARPSKTKMFISIGVVVVLLTSLALFFATRDTEQRIFVNIGTVEIKDIEETVAIRGTVQGSEHAAVSSALHYRITAVNVQEGDRVSKDQVLAVLDVKDLQDQFNRASLALRESRRAFETAEILYSEGAMSREEYLRLRAAFENDSLNVSTFNIADVRNIRSPIDGTVTRVNVTVGRYASDTERGQPMFVIENLDELQMRVSISEHDISKIRVGQSVTITADVLGGESVEGVVSRISPTGEDSMTSGEKVIPVVIDIDKGDKNLIAGVTARAAILIDRQERAIVVSIDAITRDPETGRDMVFVVSEDDVLQRVFVETGLETNIFAEVLDGALKEGDVVVLAPSFEMKDGTAVIYVR